LVQHMAILKGHTVKESLITNFTTFNPHNTIKDVIEIIISGTENNFVVLEQESIKGLLYYQDIIENAKNDSFLVKDIMNTSFKTVSSNDDLNKLYQLIHSQKNSFFPVLENGKLVGVIDSVNLNEFILLQPKLDY